LSEHSALWKHFLLSRRRRICWAENTFHGGVALQNVSAGRWQQLGETFERQRMSVKHR